MTRLAALILLVLTCVVSPPARAQVGPEVFDTSGLPKVPTTPLEQRIIDLVAAYRPGDLERAAEIQRKLARYYSQIGDLARAGAAEDRAALAVSALAEPVEEEEAVPAPEGSVSVEAPVASYSAYWGPRRPGEGVLEGRYFRREGEVLHTWEFMADGSYRYARILKGGATDVRRSERGVFRVDGEWLELRAEDAATGVFVSDAAGEERVRRLPFRHSDDAIELDGQRFEPQTW